jgi:hypothetical protein
MAARYDAYAGHLAEHVSRTLAPVSGTYEDAEPGALRIDLLRVDPTPARRLITLITCGLGLHEPPADETGARPPRCELLMTLPADWRLDAAALHEERWYWPLSWLKALALEGSRPGRWLGTGHTIPSADPPLPIAPHTRQCCMLLAEPHTAPAAFARWRLGASAFVQFLAVVPIDADEMEYKLKHGAMALLALFEQRGISDIVNPSRPSAVGDGETGWPRGELSA